MSNEDNTQEKLEAPEVSEQPETQPELEAKPEPDRTKTVMTPIFTFGYDRKAYKAGEAYVMSKSDLPTAVEGKYKTQSIKAYKKMLKAQEKKTKQTPVLGK
jgi:hypothetical protein